MNLSTRVLLRAVGCLLCVVLANGLPAFAQSASEPATQAEIDAKVRMLSQTLEETRVELSESRSEIRQLRAMLEQVLRKMGDADTPTPGAVVRREQATEKSPGNSQEAKSSDEQNLARITEDDWQIAKARLEELQQDKVESSSKYRLKLSGIALFNAFGETGHVDNLDVPTVAVPPSSGDASGSLGASLRQSIIGLAGVGPNIYGARTSGDVQMDFFGGLPSGYGATTSGVMRLRVARVRFDWENTSVVVGLDVPLFSPNTPTSYMSLSVPAFASAGNLWTWTPTIRLEQRWPTPFSLFKIEAGVMDPSRYASSSASVRAANPGEGSRQPAYSLRISANGRSENRPLSIGVSGIYLPQRYYGGETVTGWGGVADWRLPLLPHTELSGEFFAGKGLDVFGGVPYVLVQPSDLNRYNSVTAPALAGIRMLGGWSQVKVKLNFRNEFNLAAGSGARSARGTSQTALLDPTVLFLSHRNDMWFANYIFRPRSDLLFSTEYRRVRTYQVSGTPAIAGQVGMAVGFIF
ncbi:MAG: hypothetical protein DMF47_06960 [Verrucomicrobia bacterium]|nr:MAG: hypothetical protein DMF47_06960 [Verrucomicrobiota bacterium]